MGGEVDDAVVLELGLLDLVFLAVSHSSLLKHTARRILANREIPHPNWSRL